MKRLRLTLVLYDEWKRIQREYIFPNNIKISSLKFFNCRYFKSCEQRTWLTQWPIEIKEKKTNGLKVFFHSFWNTGVYKTKREDSSFYYQDNTCCYVNQHNFSYSNTHCFLELTWVTPVQTETGIKSVFPHMPHTC